MAQSATYPNHGPNYQGAQANAKGCLNRNGPYPSAGPYNSRYSGPSRFGQKRTHENAFQPTYNNQGRPKGPPPVPDFSASIPELNQFAGGTPASPISKAPKQRTSNIFGLNPSLDNADASSGDEDEELNLAAKGTSSGYQFEYRGQSSTLKTPAEIAVWISERKKRFPTAVKAAIAKQEAEERRKKAEVERKARMEATQSRRIESTRGRGRGRGRGRDGPPHRIRRDESLRNANAKETKEDRLRRKAEKAASQLQKAQEALKKIQALTDKTKLPAAPEPVLYDKQRDEKDAATDAEAPEAPGCPLPETHDIDLEADTHTSLKLSLSDLDDLTSSSGISSDSDLDSEEGATSSSDDAPEEVYTSKHTPPEHLPRTRLPARPKPSQPQICRAFMRTGQCKFGRKCRHLHEVPRKRRKGLFEVMVDKEKEQEQERMLNAIVFLGDNGFLDPPEPVPAAAESVGHSKPQ